MVTLWLTMSLCTAFAQRSNIEELATITTLENTVPRQLHHLLIISSGPMSSRKIALDIKYALDKQLKGGKFASTIVHLGGMEDCTTENIQKALNMHPHDAALLITPQLDTLPNKTYSPKPLPDYLSVALLVVTGVKDPYRPKAKREYAQQMMILNLLEGTNAQSPFWSGQTLKMTDLGSGRYYQRLVETMLNTLKEQHIFLGS